MTAVTLPLDKMTLSQKIDIIEKVWDSICQQNAPHASPAWHADMLAQRKKQHAAGTAKFSDWAEAKKRIQRETRAHARKNP